MTPDLIEHPIAADDVRQALMNLPLRPPLSDRITAAIIGVPSPETTEHENGDRVGTRFGTRGGSA